MPIADEDPEKTEVFVKACFDAGYERVEIDDGGQHIFAYPPFMKWEKKTKNWDTRPPLWGLLEIHGKMGCGNAGMKRGDNAQNESQFVNEHGVAKNKKAGVRFVPGIYIADLPMPSTVAREEEVIARRVHRRMLNLVVERPFFCPHGLKGTTGCSCWKHWGEFV